ncbi:alpha/beta hydrolase [Rhodococcus sp. OK302]|uniref:alpha/beta hydrolase n=1 Tax=Rhodococcus sp. OK302 TaxID=1882769 RepID=UPI000B9F0733|nr:alpha/beta hydrolase [Rhodococcus sp. OK302]OYD70369.1 acetyl esterase/lipase [Rhodococcus sp. OK302]
MASMDMIDPELAAVVAALTEEMMANGIPTLPERGDALGLRALLDEGMAGVPSPPSSDVLMSSYITSAPDGSDIELRWYFIDSDPSTRCPAVVYLHGGGMIGGKLDYYDGLARYYVQESTVPMLLVGYRLAPERTGTGLAEDGFTGLQWLLEHAGDLGVDGTRVAVMGDSGGGGVAAGIAILARDRGVQLAKQILIYPMLDDRTTEPDSGLENVVAWTYDNNWTCWKAVLGDDFGTDAVSPVAVPARLEDFSGLPAAYIEVGELDIFRDECIAYAQGLHEAGVSCELHVLAGVLHGYDRISFAIEVSRRNLADRCRVIGSL